MYSENSDYQDHIIQKIKKLRVDNNISQSRLGDILKISRGQVSNIENPTYPHKYTLRQIVAICDYLNYPIEKIFLDKEQSPTGQSNTITTLVHNIVKYEE